MSRATELNLWRAKRQDQLKAFRDLTLPEMELEYRRALSARGTLWRDYSPIIEQTRLNAKAVHWRAATAPNRNPDYVSESGSEYWYTSRGIVRRSDHWGIVRNSYWLLSKRVQGTVQTGRASKRVLMLDGQEWANY